MHVEISLEKTTFRRMSGLWDLRASEKHYSSRRVYVSLVKIAVGLRRVREIRPAVAPSLAQKGLKHEREYEIEDFWHAFRSPLKTRRVFT